MDYLRFECNKELSPERMIFSLRHHLADAEFSDEIAFRLAKAHATIVVPAPYHLHLKPWWDEGYGCAMVSVPIPSPDSAQDKVWIKSVISATNEAWSRKIFQLESLAQDLKIVQGLRGLKV